MKISSGQIAKAIALDAVEQSQLLQFSVESSLFEGVTGKESWEEFTVRRIEAADLVRERRLAREDPKMYGSSDRSSV